MSLEFGSKDGPYSTEKTLPCEPDLSISVPQTFEVSVVSRLVLHPLHKLRRHPLAHRCVSFLPHGSFATGIPPRAVIRDEAEALAIALRNGFVDASDAVRWAETVIEAE